MADDPPPPPDAVPDWAKALGDQVRALGDQVKAITTAPPPTNPPPPAGGAGGGAGRDLAAELDALTEKVKGWLQPPATREPNLFERAFLGHPKADPPPPAT